MFVPTEKRGRARFRSGLMSGRPGEYSPMERLALAYVNASGIIMRMTKHRDIGEASAGRDAHSFDLDIAGLEEMSMRRDASGDTAARLLAELDTHPEDMLRALENVMVWSSTEPGDEEYPDFTLPRWEIVHADRFHREINRVEFSDQDMLLEVHGTLLYLSDPVQTEYVSMAYFCNGCGDIKVGMNLKACPECGSKALRFVQKDDHTIMRNVQDALVQENVDDLARTPASIAVRFFGSDINRFTPGDRVTIMGMVRLRDTQKRGSRRYEIDTITASLTQDSTVTVTEADRERILEASRKPGVLATLAAHFLPEIVGHDDVKQAVILQAVRGMKQHRSSSVVRDRIHILLAGDPGEAKSQFLLAHRAIHEKSMYISDTSKAGITVSVADVGGKKVLSPGIMVLANQGVACLDELDKMQKDDREGMHTGMEQGIISKMKAGLRGTFAAETSVLAACNPKLGRFNIAEDIPSQLNLEPTLMDRFDLVFWFISSDAKDNRELAMRVLKPSNHADPTFLKKYIHEAMNNQVQCSDFILETIAGQWDALKKIPQNPASIGIRALEGIRRLAEASAKIRFSPWVEKEDVDIAVDLMKQSWNPVKFDLDAIRGFSITKTALMHNIMDYLRRTTSRDTTYDDLYAYMTTTSGDMDRYNFDNALETLKKTGQVYEPVSGKWRIVS